MASLDCVHREGLSLLSLLADAKLADDLAVSLRVALLQIVKQTSALTHKHQKTPARTVVLLVRFKVLRQLANALAQEGDLNLRAPGIRIVRAKLFNNRCFLGARPFRSLPLELLMGSRCFVWNSLVYQRAASAGTRMRRSFFRTNFRITIFMQPPAV